MKKIIILLVILSFLIPTFTVSGATDCKAYYYVKSKDTIEKVMKLFNVTAWDVIGSNRVFMLPPNFPLLVGARVCIPRVTGNTKFVSKSIIQAPAGEFYKRQVGNTVYITLAYWAKGQNWIVKFDNVKVGKIKIPDKNSNTFTFRVGIRTVVKRVCLKSYITDYVICR